MADFAAETALAEAANALSITDHHEAPGHEGDNKFQKAISAWRSRGYGHSELDEMLTFDQTLTSPP